MRFGAVPGVPGSVARLAIGSVLFEHDLSEGEVFALLDAYADLGGNAIDTGRHYGDRAEGSIGRWLRQRDRRGGTVILGKGAHPHGDRRRLTREDIAADLERSLALLETGYIDIYLLHRDDPTVPAGEIVEWLNEHHAAGRILAFGGSNWAPERIDEANAYAEAHGLIPFTASSPQLSLARPVALPWSGTLSAWERRDWYAERGMPLLAWSSQAQGFFTDGYRDDVRSGATWNSIDNQERRRRAMALARDFGVSATAVAVAWVLHQPFPTVAIIGPRSPAELLDSAGAMRVRLTPEQVAWLDLAP